MKTTARVHPGQGLIEYHGLGDPERAIPYHDTISVCTTPSATRPTVEFGYQSDSCLVNGTEIDDYGYNGISQYDRQVRR